jgi:hypothetical protein
MVAMYRVTEDVAEKFDVKIKGIKLVVKCKKCGRLWAIWFEDETNFHNCLPRDWYICSHCQENKIL